MTGPQPLLRRKRWVLLGCTILALFWWWMAREPSYQGRSLSKWLDNYDAILSGQMTQPGFEQTRDALLYFGNNSLSYYTKRLAYEPGWQNSVLAALGKAPGALRPICQPLWRYWSDHVATQSRRAQAALMAFKLLGPAAARAAPDLEQLALSSTYRLRTERALEALRVLGPDGVAALGRIVIHGDPGASAEALGLLNQMGNGAAPAMPLLAQGLGTNVTANPGEYYDQLIGALEDSARYSNATIRLSAMRHLAACQPRALYSLISDPNPVVRADATNVMRQTGVGAQFWDPEFSLSFRARYAAFTNTYPANMKGKAPPTTRSPLGN